jgi:protoporphyrinogen oxidase
MGSNQDNSEHIVIIGGGYTGLTAAYELSKKYKNVTIIEKEQELGGLARSFNVGNNSQQLERFYHHWFKSDTYMMDLIEELGLLENIIWSETNTGMYYASNFYKLSSPFDLLRFTAISFINRIRLGYLTLRVRHIKNWKSLEGLTTEEWLIKIAGNEVYKVVWEPLLVGKFGIYKDKVSAVWIWNKLKLRGGSRDKKGAEELAYYKGGFVALTNALEAAVKYQGVKIIKKKAVRSIEHNNNTIVGIITDDGDSIKCGKVISTLSLPLLTKIYDNSSFLLNSDTEYYRNQISSIEYIGNICLVLILNKSLSNTYWTNVNDPDFPFVALIEHTNFEPIETYAGKHVVYLSKYLPVTDELYSMSKDELLEFSLPYIKRMFKNFEDKWIDEFYLWREPYSQPIVTCNYSKKIPSYKSPISGLYVSCMAQIYPEDRGTNYAVMQGRKVANLIIK